MISPDPCPSCSRPPVLHQDGLGRWWYYRCCGLVGSSVAHKGRAALAWNVDRHRGAEPAREFQEWRIVRRAAALASTLDDEPSFAVACEVVLGSGEKEWTS